MTEQQTDQPAASDSAAAEPQPWLTDEDAEGWRVRYRGGGRRHEVKTTLVVELDATQAKWIRRESERTGLSYAAIVKRFVDQACQAELAASEPAAQPAS